MRPERIISGGQTGADQGGVAGAMLLGIPTGGTVPKGCRTERGSMPELLTVFGMVEDGSFDYPPRTRKNVCDSDGTVWVGNVGSPGYWCTKRAVDSLKREWIQNPSPEQLAAWVDEHGIKVLNVAGNRESTNRGLFERTKLLIMEAFS